MQAIQWFLNRRARDIGQCLILLAAGVLAAPVGAAERALTDAAWVDRITWGATPQTVSDVQRMGRSAWLARQLRPGPPTAMPAPVQAQIDAMKLSQVPFDQIVDNLERLRIERQRSTGARMPRQTRVSRLLRTWR